MNLKRKWLVPSPDSLEGEIPSGGSMDNIVMIRSEPGLVSIPVERAVYCRACETISTSVKRCGLCGSEQVIELAPLLSDPWDPGPVAANGLAA